MPVISGAEPKRRWIVWIAVFIGLAICEATLILGHFLSIGAAAMLGIVFYGLAAAILILTRSDRPASLAAHLRLIWIYLGIGVVALMKALLRGWTRDDSVGAAILTVIVTLFVISYLQQRSKNSRADHL